MIRRAGGMMSSTTSVLLVVNDRRRPGPNTCQRSSRKALVVDDDPAVQRALSRWLRPELDSCLVGSVWEASTLLSTLDRIDLAFVDLELPDGSGEQVLQLMTRWPDAITVLMSGSLRTRAAAEEALLMNRALANLVLAKPIAFEVIDALKKAALELANV